MMTRILTDLLRSILNAAAIVAALSVLFVGGIAFKVTRWKR